MDREDRIILYEEAIGKIEDMFYELNHVEDSLADVDDSIRYDVMGIISQLEDVQSDLEESLRTAQEESVEEEDYMKDQPKLPGMEDV